jgi:acylphosphatase
MPRLRSVPWSAPSRSTPTRRFPSADGPATDRALLSGNAVLEQLIRRFQITGRVQGVNFRYSTRVEALRLGVRGYAQNLPDGSVEVLAYGAAAAVEELRRWLHGGPRMARVERVLELDVKADTRAPAMFEIL